MSSIDLNQAMLRVVDMVRLVVEDHQLVDVAHDHAQVDLAVGRRAGRPRAEEVVHRVLVVRRSRDVIAGVDAMDVRQKDVARLAG